MDADIGSRFGRFHIARGYINDYPDEVLVIMARCIILRAEVLWTPDVVEYVAISQEFEKATPNCDPPFYVWQMDGGRATAIKSY